MKILFFAPVFNQVRELPRVLAEFRESAPPDVGVLLVNNGSSDGSERLVRESGYPFLDLPRNLGVGHGYIRARVLLVRRIRWTEIPVTMRYPETGRYSKIRPGRDWYAMLKPWLRARIDGKGFRAA